MEAKQNGFEKKICVDIAGIGCGSLQDMTREAYHAVMSADLVIGAARMIDAFCDYQGDRAVHYKADEIVDCILTYEGAHPEKERLRIAAVFSGDTGFYSGADSLQKCLAERIPEASVCMYPGISSLLSFSAKIRRPWQDWRLVSAHGIPCDPVYEVMQGQPVFFLTGGENTVSVIAEKLTKAGLGGLKLYVGEKLSGEEERIFADKAEQIAGKTFSSLSVLLAEAASVYPKRTSGIEDDAFIREKVPMTKQEVRAAILAKLAVRPDDVCWDIGAGTGSVSIEMALHCRSVWALECKEEAVSLIRRNREKFGAWNLHVVSGWAPEALEDFPVPDVVFIGGSSGRMKEILEIVFRKNPHVRICISAIALETLHAAVQGLKELGRDAEVTQIAVSRTKPAGELNLLMAQNPVFLINSVKSIYET